MDIEERIRELKRELEMLEAQKLAPQAGDNSPYGWFAENPTATPQQNQYIQKMPYVAPPAGTGAPAYQNMPYKKPAPSMNGPRNPGQYIKKL